MTLAYVTNAVMAATIVDSNVVKNLSSLEGTSKGSPEALAGVAVIKAAVAKGKAVANGSDAVSVAYRAFLTALENKVEGDYGEDAQT